MPIVEHAAFTYKYLVLLINSSLHFMEKRTRTWHSIQVPGDEPVIGLRGRDTCHTGHFYMVAIEDVAFHSIPSHIAIALASENAHLPMLYIVIIDVILRQEAYIFEQIKVNNNLMFLVSGNLSFLAWDDDIMIYYFDKTFYDVDLPSGHLVEPGETIQQVVVSPTDEMVVRTSRNRLQYGVPGDVGSVMSVTLESGELPDSPVELWFDARGNLYSITLSDSVVTRRLILIPHELVSASFPKTECPYLEFSTNFDQKVIHMDKIESFEMTCRLIHKKKAPRLTIKMVFDGLYTLTVTTDTHQDSYGDYFMKLTFNQEWDEMRKKYSYAELIPLSARTVSVQLLPSARYTVCTNTSLVTHISVGCRAGWNIRIKRPKQHKDNCERITEYLIEGKYRHDYWNEDTMSDITVPYDFDTLGCPITLQNIDTFMPDIELYDFDKFVRPVEANVILWEIHGRKDYGYNKTMYRVLCWRKAQSWQTMAEKFKAGTPPDEMWGQENYESCFDRSEGLSTKAELSRPYEILNRTGGVGIMFPIEYHAIFVFNVKVVDPDFSFCSLATQFAIVIPHRGFSSILKVLTLFGITVLLFAFLIGSYIYFAETVYLKTE